MMKYVGEDFQLATVVEELPPPMSDGTVAPAATAEVVLEVSPAAELMMPKQQTKKDD
jgi:hypothetical protein